MKKRKVLILLICFAFLFSISGGIKPLAATTKPTFATFSYNGAAVLTSVAINETLAYSPNPVYLTVTGSYTDGTSQVISSGVDWSSSDTHVATVDSNGVVTFTGNLGPVTITASYSGKTASVNCTVAVSLMSITIDPLKYNPLPSGLSVIGHYSDGTSHYIKSGATWKSSNTRVATVNSKGIITFSGNSGTVTITASYSGKTASSTCTVGNVVKSLSTTTKLAYSKTPVTVTLFADYSNGSKVKIKSGAGFKSSNPNIATVNEYTGVVTFTGKNGAVTIYASYQGRILSVSTKVDVKAYYLKFYTGKTWKVYHPSKGVLYPYGTLTIYANGTYTLKIVSHHHVKTYTGKWKWNKDYSLTIYRFDIHHPKVAYRIVQNNKKLSIAPRNSHASIHFIGQ